MNLTSLKNSIKENSLIETSNIINVLKKNCSNLNDIFLEESILEEPLIRSYEYIASNLPFNQIIYGYVKNKDRLLALTNDNGIIFIPKLGYIKTIYPNEFITLNFLDSTYTFNKTTFPLKIETSIVINNIEIYKYDNDSIKLRLEQLAIPFVTHSKYLNKYHQIFEDVLKYIKTMNIDVYTLFIENIKSIYIFDHKKVHSFTEITLNGVIFINLNIVLDFHQCVEQCIHEMSHCLLNRATLDYDNWFKVDFQKPSYNSPLIEGKRGLLRSIHACFVSYILLMFYDSCYVNDRNQNNDFEIIGRLMYYIDRLNFGVEELNDDNLYNFKGIELVNQMSTFIQNKKIVYAKIIKEYDISKQGFDYKHKQFLNENSL